MTINRGLWVPINTGNVGTTDLEARLADAALFESNNGADARSGILNPSTPTLVTGTANMTYNLAACNPVITRAANEGVYRFSGTGVTNVATTAAPTANSRIDIIWVKQNDQSKGDANNLAAVGVAQGAVAASPVAPSIPAGAMEVARATVGPNITGTNAASITNTFRYAALKGTPIPVRNTTERGEITAPRAGQLVARLDLDAAGRSLERWTGTAWATVPIVQGREYAVTLDAFSVGTITFDEPFPNALLSVSLMRAHTTAGQMYFNVLTGAGNEATGKNGVKFVASSGGGSTIYVYVMALGK